MQAQSKLELIHHAAFYDEEGWREVQIALDGVLSVPLQYHKAAIENMSEPEFFNYLARMGASMIARYGDARNPRPEGSVN